MKEQQIVVARKAGKIIRKGNIMPQKVRKRSGKAKKRNQTTKFKKVF